jgi:hypothetical protein
MIDLAGLREMEYVIGGEPHKNMFSIEMKSLLATARQHKMTEALK